MDYMPVAASLAASHKGRRKNIQLLALHDGSQNLDPRTCILKFESDAKKHDLTKKKISASFMLR